MSALTTALTEIWDGQLTCYDAETVTIAGTPYACEGSEVIQEDQTIVGGIMQLPNVRVALKRSLLSAEPAIGAAVVYRSKNYSVARTQTTPDNTVIIIECEPRNARR